MLPTVVAESSVQSFCFYADGDLCDGVRYQNRLYRLVQTLEVGDRTGVRQVCQHLHRNGQPCIITTSKRYYKVWTDICPSMLMRSLITASLDHAELK